jgi:hypothetical protein
MGKAAHMMERPASVCNRLLAALPSNDLALLAPHLQKVSLERDAVVAQSGNRREHVYFPHSGAISFMLGLPNGETIASRFVSTLHPLIQCAFLGIGRRMCGLCRIARLHPVSQHPKLIRKNSPFCNRIIVGNAIIHINPEKHFFRSLNDLHSFNAGDNCRAPGGRSNVVPDAMSLAIAGTWRSSRINPQREYRA